MKGLKFDFERSAGEAGGLPMYLALRGDLSDPGEILLKLRALQTFDRGAARYLVYKSAVSGANGHRLNNGFTLGVTYAFSILR
jgi:hypothetical protein